MGTYVSVLVLIYEKATGKRMGRRYNAYTGVETPHPFLVECIRAVGRRYPPRVVQNVLADLKKNRPRGKSRLSLPKRT
jgi:hypothetical protein